MSTALDQERTEGLACAFLEIIKANYLLGPVSRDRCFEALNALAFCAAFTIRGADDPEALRFFLDAFNLSLDSDCPPQEKTDAT